MSDRPTIKVRIFEESHWISLDDHKMDVQRYKDAQTDLERKLSSQKTLIIELQAKLIKSNPQSKGIMDELFDGIFGSAKR